MFRTDDWSLGRSASLAGIRQNIALLSGIQEKLNGNSEKANGPHGASGGYVVPRRAADAHHRDLLAEQLPARSGL